MPCDCLWRSLCTGVYDAYCVCVCCAGERVDEGEGGDNEVQRTMLELINQLDGFDARGNIKVLMATNRSVRLL